MWGLCKSIEKLLTGCKFYKSSLFSLFFTAIANSAANYWDTKDIFEEQKKIEKVYGGTREEKAKQFSL
jgi:hypothetical protein